MCGRRAAGNRWLVDLSHLDFALVHVRVERLVAGHSRLAKVVREGLAPAVKLSVARVYRRRECTNI
jgi:hypothetical protein